MLLLLECSFGYVCGLLINDALSHQARALLVILDVARHVVSVVVVVRVVFVAAVVRWP